MKHGVEPGRGERRSRSLNLWLPLESRDDFCQTVGKTVGSCCCDHEQCGSFRQKAWCRRLFAITIGMDSPVDESSGRAAVETVATRVKSSLASRACEDCSFRMLSGKGVGADFVLLVLLADGEPPLFGEDLQVWNDCAATVSADHGSCYVKMSRCTCCLFRASFGLCQVARLGFECSDVGVYSLPEGALLEQLMLESGDTDVEDGEIIEERTKRKCITRRRSTQ